MVLPHALAFNECHGIPASARQFHLSGPSMASTPVQVLVTGMRRGDPRGRNAPPPRDRPFWASASDDLPTVFAHAGVLQSGIAGAPQSEDRKARQIMPPAGC